MGFFITNTKAIWASPRGAEKTKTTPRLEGPNGRRISRAHVVQICRVRSGGIALGGAAQLPKIGEARETIPSKLGSLPRMRNGGAVLGRLTRTTCRLQSPRELSPSRPAAADPATSTTARYKISPAPGESERLSHSSSEAEGRIRL